MEEYIAIEIRIRTNTKWYIALKNTLKHIGEAPKKKGFHITISFMNESHISQEVVIKVNEWIKFRKAPILTFDKLDAFTTLSGDTHVVCLTSTQPEKEFIELVDGIRDIIESHGIRQVNFKLHMTLAQIKVNKIRLNDLQEKLSKINVNFSLRPSKVYWGIKGSKIHRQEWPLRQ